MKESRIYCGERATYIFQGQKVCAFHAMNRLEDIGCIVVKNRDSSGLLKVEIKEEINE